MFDCGRTDRRPGPLRGCRPRRDRYARRSRGSYAPPRRASRPCARRRCRRHRPGAGWADGWRARRRSARASRSSRSCAGLTQFEAHLELQIGDDRDQVGVAAALAEAVDRALHLRAPARHGGQRVGHGVSLSLWVWMPSALARDRLAPPRRRSRSISSGRRPAVGVAQHEPVARPRFCAACEAGHAHSRGWP